MNHQAAAPTSTTATTAPAANAPRECRARGAGVVGAATGCRDRELIRAILPPEPCVNLSRYTEDMKTRYAFAAVAILAATGLGYAVQAQQAAPTKVVVYKSPT